MNKVTLNRISSLNLDIDEQHEKMLILQIINLTVLHFQYERFYINCI